MQLLRLRVCAVGARIDAKRGCVRVPLGCWQSSLAMALIASIYWQVLEEELYSLLIDIYRSPKTLRVLSEPTVSQI